MSAVVGGVPCLIREVLYAPPCPVPVAQLFEVALVQHNNGALEDAINTFLEAQSLWERSILETDYTDLEDPAASSMLATLMKREKELEEDALATEVDARIMKAEQDVAFTEAKERQEAAAAAAAAAAEALEENSEPSVVKFHEDDGTSTAESDRVHAVLYTTADLKKFREERAKRLDAREVAKALDQSRTQERHERKMQAMYESARKVPVEALIFIQLSVGSVLESSGSDEAALRCYVYALELCEKYLGDGRPQRHPVTATVFSALGTLYFHIAQYDFAADYFFKALEIREQLLPTGHVDVAMLLNNVGCVLHLLRRTNDALVFFYRAASMLETQLDPTHPRRDVVDGNIRKAQQSSLFGATPPPVPFVPGIVPPLIPGARRAREYFKPKPKKPKGKDDGKKK
jgi:tetratricopeptide (TPR) repeat protein